MHEHVTDPYVQRAKAEGYRSRASFKLMEIDDRDHLIRPGEVVVFHEHHVVQARAVIGAAPDSHRVLRKRPQAGQGLARIAH